MKKIGVHSSNECWKDHKSPLALRGKIVVSSITIY
jgi:hypothetical protein